MKKPNLWWTRRIRCLAKHRPGVEIFTVVLATVVVALVGLVIEDLLPNPGAAAPNPDRIWLAGGFLFAFVVALWLRSQLDKGYGTLYYARHAGTEMPDWHADELQAQMGHYLDQRVIAEVFSAARSAGEYKDLTAQVSLLDRRLQAEMNRDQAATSFALAPNLIVPSAMALGFELPFWPGLRFIELNGRPPLSLKTQEWKIPKQWPRPTLTQPPAVWHQELDLPGWHQELTLPSCKGGKGCKYHAIVVGLTATPAPVPPTGIETATLVGFPATNGRISEPVHVETDMTKFQPVEVVVSQPVDTPRPRSRCCRRKATQSVEAIANAEPVKAERRLHHVSFEAAAEGVFNAISELLHELPEESYLVLVGLMPKTVAVASGWLLANNKCQRNPQQKNGPPDPCGQPGCRDPWSRLIVPYYDQTLGGLIWPKVHPGQDEAAIQELADANR